MTAWQGAGMRDDPRDGRRRAALLLVTGALVTGCTAGSDPAPPDRGGQAAPPPPPAACRLDTAALAADTGLGWTPDETTANDTRCVYDPDAPAGTARTSSVDFVAVEVAPSAGAATAELDNLAELCEAESRISVAAADGAFVCRFGGGSVFAALIRGGEVLTVAASAVPPGTSAAHLVVAFTQQLSRLGA